jgi:hypothetical protein
VRWAFHAGVDELFECVRGRWRAPRPREGGRDPLCPGMLADCGSDGRTQAVGAEALHRQAGAGIAPGDVAGDLELVATERHYAHRHPCSERALGDSHAAVADDAGCAVD